MVEDHHVPVPVPSNLNLDLDLDPNPNHWSMVVIRHPHEDTNECSVFPPSNHENLQIFPHFQHHNENPAILRSSLPSPSSSSSFSPSDSDTCGLSFSTPFDSQVGKRRGGGDFVQWMSIGLEIMRSKLSAVASSFRSGASRRGAFWSIWVPAAAVVMSSWIMIMRTKRRRRRRRSSLTQNETRLLDIIREKDEKIGQLLHQIAQMNEILIARHKALAATVAK